MSDMCSVLVLPCYAFTKKTTVSMQRDTFMSTLPKTFQLCHVLNVPQVIDPRTLQSLSACNRIRTWYLSKTGVLLLLSSRTRTSRRTATHVRTSATHVDKCQRYGITILVPWHHCQKGMDMDGNGGFAHAVERHLLSGHNICQRLSKSEDAHRLDWQDRKRNHRLRTASQRPVSFLQRGSHLQAFFRDW